MSDPTRFKDAAGLDEAEPCDACPPRPYGGPVSWSPAFAVWLCNECRIIRTARELRATDKASEAARLSADLAAGQAAGDK